MRKPWKSEETKGIEDYLKELCQIYRGEIDNPHDVNSLIEEERAIQFLKYNLWDVERSKEFGIDLTSLYSRFRKNDDI